MPKDSAGHLTAGTLSPTRLVPASIARPEYVGKVGPAKYDGGDVYSAEMIAKIRRAGRIASQALDAVGAAVRPGITTDELDVIGHNFVVAAGAYPSTLGYRQYPKSLCTSVNEVICHGIPDNLSLIHI
jgi:methionyl aminopeptidase